MTATLPTDEELEAAFRVDLQSGLRYLAGIQTILFRDTGRCLATVQALERDLRPDDPAFADELVFWYRTLLRTMFSYIDGVVASMRQVLLWAHERGELDLAAEELVLLRETTYGFNTTRKRIEGRPAPNRFLENLLLTLDLFPRAFGLTLRPNFSDHRWDSFQKSLRARHIMTHPKSLKDLRLDFATIKHLREALGWFTDNATELIGTCQRALTPPRPPPNPVAQADG